MQSTKNYVGIDISKLQFDVAIEKADDYSHCKLANNLSGFRCLLKMLPDNAHVVMEASGAYYLQLATFLYDKGIPVSVINPLVIRRFCQMRMVRAKTDKKDAAMIAAYGKTEKPDTWHPDAPYVLELRQMLASVELLTRNRTAILNQQEAFKSNTTKSKAATKALNDTLRVIEKKITDMELEMQRLIEKHHGPMYQNLQTIPGLGKKTTLVLIVLSGGFKKFSDPRQLISYIGLCPRIYESGTSVKGRARITKMGMSRIRALLYVCAWTAKKCNSACKALYERLLAKGKSKRLALIAVANKLLKQAFAIATQNIIYDPNYQKNICF